MGTRIKQPFVTPTKHRGPSYLSLGYLSLAHCNANLRVDSSAEDITQKEFIYIDRKYHDRPVWEVRVHREAIYVFYGNVINAPDGTRYIYREKLLRSVHTLYPSKMDTVSLNYYKIWGL